MLPTQITLSPRVPPPPLPDKKRREKNRKERGDNRRYPRGGSETRRPGLSEHCERFQIRQIARDKFPGDIESSLIPPIAPA